jgi:hypothetical protein
MRRSIIMALSGCLILSVMAGPALAGKKKKVSDSFSATLLPFPKLAQWGDVVGLTRPGCSSGQQDIHWASMDFKAPFDGKLDYHSEGFVGDWDIYVFDKDLPIGKSEQEQIAAQAPAEESILIDLKKGQEVTLVLCNWLGGPDGTATFDFVSR